ncbi:MAG TPA: oligosaccharide flippase family protein [Gemmatimonadales bacterium]|nr:oligosaccharide flippase family protein [Gemmatimonadales bacterium]
MTTFSRPVLIAGERAASTWRALAASPAVRAGAAFTLTGVGFSIANLILARALAPTDYGLVALVVGVLSVAAPVAPAGADLVLVRGLSEPRRRLFLRGCATASITAVLAAAWAAAVYRLAPSLLGLLAAGTIAGGLATLSAAWFQRRSRFAVSLGLAQSSNILLLGAAVLTWAVGATHAILPLALTVAGSAAVAAVGWRLVAGDRTRAADATAFRWADALSLVVFNSAGLVFMQLERLIAPSVLTLTDLATFGVAAALVGSPFRMLQSGVIFTVVPRLRAESTPRRRRALLAHELRLVALVMLAVAAAVVLLAPLLTRTLLGGKYELAPALIGAMLASGVAKVLTSFVSGTVTALAGTRRLSVLGVVSWGSVAAGIAGAIVGARWGLAGLVYGATAGWAVRLVATAALAWPYLREGASSRSAPTGSAPTGNASTGSAPAD